MMETQRLLSEMKMYRAALMEKLKAADAVILDLSSRESFTGGGKWLANKRRVKPTPKPKPRPTGKQAFKPDPNSLSSRMLKEAITVIESKSGTASFLDIYHGLSQPLKQAPNAREIARSAMIRSGKRVGIEYISKDKVILTKRKA